MRYAVISDGHVTHAAYANAAHDLHWYSSVHCHETAPGAHIYGVSGMCPVLITDLRLEPAHTELTCMSCLVWVSDCRWEEAPEEWYPDE
jgi:hypothetical protein